MRSVLFTHSYFYQLDSKQWRFKQPYPPLATILAAAFIRQHDFSVSLFDTNLKNSPSGVSEILDTKQPQYFIIYDDSFNYLSKMCLTNMREAAFEMAKQAKSRGCVVIVSSSDAADHYENYLSKNIDFVIRGEAEETLLELLQCLNARVETSHIPGIVYKSNEIVKVNQPRSAIKNLDSFPLPAWDLVDIDAYRKIWMKHHGYFSLNVATTRGCPFKCNWCAKPIYGNRYTSRSPEHVIKEIEFLLNEYKPDHFWMCDDIFGLKPGWLHEFSNLVETRKLSFNYKIQSRADLLVNEKTVEDLARSGAETVWLGAESGSQKILDAMDKGITVAQIKEATHMLHQRNIKVALFLQFGYLGETREDIDATIEMVLDLMPDEIGISVSYPLPGTKFYEKVKDQLQNKQNWQDSDDLAMMFQSTFQGSYYKELHRYVHAVYRTQKGFRSVKKLLSNPFRLNTKDLRSGLALFYFYIKSYLLNKRLSKLNNYSSIKNLSIS